MQQSLESQTLKDRRNIQILNAIDPQNTYYLRQPKVAEFNPNKTTIGFTRVPLNSGAAVSGLSSRESTHSLKESAEKAPSQAVPPFVTTISWNLSHYSFFLQTGVSASTRHKKEETSPPPGEQLPLSYRDRVVARDELKEMQKILMRKCNELINKSFPFKDRNLTTKRLFDDCLDVYLGNAAVTASNPVTHRHISPELAYVRAKASIDAQLVGGKPKSQQAADLKRGSAGGKQTSLGRHRRSATKDYPATNALRRNEAFT